MGDKLSRLWIKLNIIRSMPAILSVNFSSSKALITKDIDRWVNIRGYKMSDSWILGLNWLLVKYPEYRNLLYCRIKKDNKILAYFLYIFYKPINSLFIYTEDIGEGFFIQHGFSTIITAERIGKNCSVNQQVTIGYGNSDKPPIIEDNVQIASGAKVFGEITIGENTKVGANCVVHKDVPKNCTVVGVPGRIVKKDGVKVDIKL